MHPCPWKGGGTVTFKPRPIYDLGDTTSHHTGHFDTGFIALHLPPPAQGGWGRWGRSQGSPSSRGSPSTGSAPRPRRVLPLAAVLEHPLHTDTAQVAGVHRQQHHGAREGLVAKVCQLLFGHHGCTCERGTMPGWSVLEGT